MKRLNKINFIINQLKKIKFHYKFNLMKMQLINAHNDRIISILALGNLVLLLIDKSIIKIL